MYKKVHNNIEYGGQTFTDSHILFLHLRTSHIFLRPTLSQRSMKIHLHYNLNFDRSENDVVIVAEMNEKRNPYSL